MWNLLLCLIRNKAREKVIKKTTKKAPRGAFLLNQSRAIKSLATITTKDTQQSQQVGKDVIDVEVDRVINGGETNYIMATLAIYLDVYNVFTNLLALIGIVGGNRD